MTPHVALPTILHSWPVPQCDIYRKKKEGKKNSEDAFRGYFCPAADTRCSSGITKCLHIISATQRELFISFHIAVGKGEGGKKNAHSALTGVFVLNNIRSKSLPIHTPGREQDSYSCPRPLSPARRRGNLNSISPLHYLSPPPTLVLLCIMPGGDGRRQ